MQKQHIKSEISLIDIRINDLKDEVKHINFLINNLTKDKRNLMKKIKK